MTESKTLAATLTIVAVLVAAWAAFIWALIQVPVVVLALMIVIGGREAAKRAVSRFRSGQVRRA